MIFIKRKLARAIVGIAGITLIERAIFPNFFLRSPNFEAAVYVPTDRYFQINARAVVFQRQNHPYAMQPIFVFLYWQTWNRAKAAKYAAEQRTLFK